MRKWYETFRDEGCDFFLWGFVKDIVFVPPVPANLQELRDRITAAVALIDPDMLTRLRNELDYRLDQRCPWEQLRSFARCMRVDWKSIGARG